MIGGRTNKSTELHSYYYFNYHAAITLHAGKRKLTLKPADVDHYRSERGRRGNKLPRGLQRVSYLEVELPKISEETSTSDQADTE